MYDVACSVHVVLDWVVFQWASMAEDPMGWMDKSLMILSDQGS